MYKKEKNLQGAKIMYVTDNDLFYHYLEVINDWLYLTGKLPQLKQDSTGKINDNAKTVMRSNYNNAYGGNQQRVESNPSEIAHIVLIEHTRRNGNKIAKNDLNNLLQKKIKSEQVNEVIMNLERQGFIMDDGDDGYDIFTQ